MRWGRETLVALILSSGCNGLNQQLIVYDDADRTQWGGSVGFARWVDENHPWYGGIDCGLEYFRLDKGDDSSAESSINLEQGEVSATKKKKKKRRHWFGLQCKKDVSRLHSDNFAIGLNSGFGILTQLRSAPTQIELKAKTEQGYSETADLNVPGGEWSLKNAYMLWGMSAHYQLFGAHLNLRLGTNGKEFEPALTYVLSFGF